MLNVIIPEGTIAFNETGTPLTEVEFTAVETSPLPEQASIVGLAYDLRPGRASFSQPVTIIWNYNPADLPPELDETDLVVACYDDEASKWEELLSITDSKTDTITAFVDHFGIIAILAHNPPPPTPAPATFTISSLSVALLEASPGEEEGSYPLTLKINEVIEETREITLAGSTSETVTFITAQDEVGTHSINANGLLSSFIVRETESATATATPTKQGWWLNGDILAAMGVAITVPLVIKRRQRKRNTSSIESQ